MLQILTSYKAKMETGGKKTLFSPHNTWKIERNSHQIQILLDIAGKKTTKCCPFPSQFQIVTNQTLSRLFTKILKVK